MSVYKDYMISSDNNVHSNALANKGEQYAFYLYHAEYEDEWGSHFMPIPGNYTESIILNSIPAGNYFVEWIEPATGSLKSSETIKWEGGDLKLETPSYSIDLALKITRKKRGFLA